MKSVEEELRLEELDLFNWPNVEGKRVLCVGLGGGSDVITAYAVSTLLNPGPRGQMAYGNTKGRAERDLIQIARQIYRVQGEPVPPSEMKARHNTTGIDRTIPRGPLGTPLVFVLPKQDRVAQETLCEEIKALGFDLIIGVDTGGDAMEIPRRRRKRRGRDQRMLRVVRETGAPCLLVVVGLGADGQADAGKLYQAFTEQRRRSIDCGRFELDRILEEYRKLSPYLPARRTPNIILRAAESTEDECVVHRDARPRSYPRSWLVMGLAFSLQ